MTSFLASRADRQHLLSSARQLGTDALDGLSSLAGYYINVERRKLFTHFYVDINQLRVMAAAAAIQRYVPVHHTEHAKKIVPGRISLIFQKSQLSHKILYSN